MPLRGRPEIHQVRPLREKMDWNEFLGVDWTGNCYAGAYHLAECLATHGRNPIVVHGKQTSSGVDHAWVEVGDFVADATKRETTLAPFGAQVFYRHHEAKARYTWQEALLQFAKNQHYGPWDESRP
jgi:hypothetical protein